MNPITIDDEIRCAREELAISKKVYPKWLQERKAGWDADKVRYKLACKEAILERLQKAKGLQELGDQFALNFPTGKPQTPTPQPKAE
jgi:hypothetical protein